MTKTKRLAGKLALITGATQGLGAAIAEAYAREGADLILVGREAKSLEDIDDRVKSYGASAMLVPLDLHHLHAIDELAVAIASRYRKLDILVGNAGVLGHLGPIVDTPATEWQNVMNINLNANWHLLKAMDPLLKQSPSGRAIFVTSGVTHNVSSLWSAYAVSKTALEMMVKIYASETQNTYPHLKVNLVDPGKIRTRMRAQAMPGEDPMTLPTAASVADVFVDLALETCQSHGQVIQAQRKCA